jgi:hypothetical protein
MSALFIVLAIIRLAQLLLFAGYAVGRNWCLVAFLAITAFLLIADIVIFITIHFTNKQIERSEP